MGWRSPATEIEYEDVLDKLSVSDNNEEVVFRINDCDSVFVQYADLPVLIEFLQKRVPA